MRRCRDAALLLLVASNTIHLLGVAARLVGAHYSARRKFDPNAFSALIREHETTHGL